MNRQYIYISHHPIILLLLSLVGTISLAAVSHVRRLPAALEVQKLGQRLVDDSRVDAAVGRVPDAPGGAVVVADHAVLSDDEPVRCLLLDPVLAVMFAVHHVTAFPGLRVIGRGRGAARRGGTAAAADDADAADVVAGGGGGADAADAVNDIGGAAADPRHRGRGGRLQMVMVLHAVHPPVAQHAHRLVNLVVLLRFRVHPFRFDEQPFRVSVIQRLLPERGRRRRRRRIFYGL